MDTTNFPALRALLPAGARIRVIHDSPAWLHETWLVNEFKGKRAAIGRMEIRVSRGTRFIAAILWKPGPFRFNAVNQLQSLGTYVATKYWGQGIGAQLWEEMLEMSQTRQVTSHVVSNEGAMLIEKMRRRHPGIKWRIHDKRRVWMKKARPELLEPLLEWRSSRRSGGYDQPYMDPSRCGYWPDQTAPNLTGGVYSLLHGSAFCFLERDHPGLLHRDQSDRNWTTPEAVRSFVDDQDY